MSLLKHSISRGHVGVEGFLDWQFSWVLTWLCPPLLPHLICYCWLLQHSSLAGILVLLQSGLMNSLGITKVGLAIAAGDSVYHCELLNYRQGAFHFGKHRVKWPPRSEDQLHAVLPADPLDVFTGHCCVWQHPQGWPVPLLKWWPLWVVYTLARWLAGREDKGHWVAFLPPDQMFLDVRDGGTGSPGSGLCGWAFCRPWAPGHRHPVSRNRSVLSFSSSMVNLMEGHMLLSWSKSDSVVSFFTMQQVSLIFLFQSRCFSRAVQGLQRTVYRGWPPQQRWVNPLLHLPVIHRRLLHSWSM